MWISRSRAAAPLVLLLLAAAPAPAGAQAAHPCPWTDPAPLLADRASPPDSAAVRVGGADVKVCYSSPRVRGRLVMGGLVPYGRTWRTGANEPTTLFVSAPVLAAGVRLEPGTYIVLTTPGPREWEVHFHTTHGETTQDRFANAVEVGRGRVAAGRAQGFAEAFRIHGESGESRGTLVLEWEETRVEIPLQTPAR